MFLQQASCTPSFGGLGLMSRVERTAGTFQDRLVTELRLAGAVTIEEANALLKEFLDRFNARFGVPAQHPEAAYRPLGPGVCLDTASASGTAAGWPGTTR